MHYSTSPLAIILIVLLVVLFIGALPRWGYSANWGYYPGGMLGIILIAILILAILGMI